MRDRRDLRAARPDVVDTTGHTTDDFERRIGDVAEAFKREGFADDMIGKAIVAGIFPQLRKRAKRDPAGMRRGLAQVFAELIAMLGLEPAEIFPDRVASPRTPAAIDAGLPIERGSVREAPAGADPGETAR